MCLSHKFRSAQLFLPPLPLPQDGQEGPQIELGPEDVEEGDLGLLVALPEHEVAETMDVGGADE